VEEEMETAELARRTVMIGEVEVDAAKALDPTTVEGLALTQWQLPVGAFRVDRNFSLLQVRFPTHSLLFPIPHSCLPQVNPKWRSTTDLPVGESNDAWTTRVHPDDREAMVANYKQVVTDLEAGNPQEHNEFEFRVRLPALFLPFSPFRTNLLFVRSG
jgi:hypothetical protein